MTGPGSRAGSGPLAFALALLAAIVLLGWIESTTVETAQGSAEGCRAACPCREASP